MTYGKSAIGYNYNIINDLNFKIYRGNKVLKLVMTNKIIHKNCLDLIRWSRWSNLVNNWGESHMHFNVTACLTEKAYMYNPIGDQYWLIRDFGIK